MTYVHLRRHITRRVRGARLPPDAGFKDRQVQYSLF